MADINFNSTTEDASASPSLANSTSGWTNHIPSPETVEKIYNSLFLFAVYVVPLAVIIITYANILAKLFRKGRENSNSKSGGTSFFNVISGRKKKGNKAIQIGLFVSQIILGPDI